MDGNYGNHTREYDYWRDFLNMKYVDIETIRIDLKMIINIIMIL